MAGFIRSIAPGVALGGIALGLVAGFDKALHPGPAAAGGHPTETSETTAGAADTTCDTARTVTGDLVQTRWGPVQVEAAVAGDGTICDSQAVVYPDGDGESVAINSRALPIIERQVAQQGVEFDGVSGATYTTEGYRMSLQSILDQL